MKNDTIARYRLIERELATAKTEQKKSEDNIKLQSNRISLLEIWLKELGAAICKKCNGHGELWNHVSQSEAYLEKCDKCDGSGTAIEQVAV